MDFPRRSPACSPFLSFFKPFGDAWITLTCLDNSQSGLHNQRVLPCSPESPIAIGRASKDSRQNNRKAGVTNALFECPVMTKIHAELSVADRVKGPVYLTDLGSRHGTFINNKKLVEHVPYRLTSGDRVRFGGDVQAASAVHKGLLMDINFDLPEANRRRKGYSSAPTSNKYSLTYSDDELEEIDDPSMSTMQHGKTHWPASPDLTTVEVQDTYAEPEVIPIANTPVVPIEPCDDANLDSEEDDASYGCAISDYDEDDEVLDRVDLRDAAGDITDQSEDEDDEASSVEGYSDDERDSSVTQTKYDDVGDEALDATDDDSIAAPLIHAEAEVSRPPMALPQYYGHDTRPQFGIQSTTFEPVARNATASEVMSGLTAPDNGSVEPDPADDAVLPMQFIPSMYQSAMIDGSFGDTASERQRLGIHDYSRSPLQQLDDMNANNTEDVTGTEDVQRKDSVDTSYKRRVEASTDNDLESSIIFQPTELPASRERITIKDIMNLETIQDSAGKKRKADVLEESAPAESVGTMLTVETSTPPTACVHTAAQTVPCDNLTELISPRPVKRARTTVRTGLQMTACAVAGSVATFGFLISPWAQRLAEL